jgi:hypothetical protein
MGRRARTPIITYVTWIGVEETIMRKLTQEGQR